MSIRKQINSIPNTGRTFESDNNGFAYLSGIFISLNGFEFSSEEDFQDIDVWQQAMNDGNITPLHYIKEVQPQDQETEYQESIQDFSYRTFKGKYRHRLNYVWTLDKHKLVELMSGGSLPVFHYDRNNNISGTSNGSGGVKGFTTTRIVLEKMIQATQSDPAFSPLDIEYKDSDELNVNGVIKKVEWQPTDIDRLFMSITVEFVDSDNLNFSASYNGEPVEDIEDSEVTVTDYLNGVLSFSTFELGSGTYQLSGFSNTLTSGKLEVITDLYLGCNKYRVTITVDVTNNFIFEDDDNMILEDGDNLILEN